MDLSIATSSGDVFTYPTVALNDPASAPDPSRSIASWKSVHGGNQASMLVIVVKLTIPPKAKPPERIDSLTITLASHETMNFPSGYWEQNVPFYDKLEVASAAGMPIQAGSTYHWDVPVLIPCNAAPYERGRSGRNYWRAAAKMQLPGLILKKHVTSEKNLFIIATPLDETYSYDHVHSGLAEGLGPIQLSFISRSFNVGGYLRGAMLLPAPSPTLKLHAVTMTLLQTVELHSRKKPGVVERYPTERYEFLNLGAEELDNYVKHTGALCRREPCREEGAIQMEWIARLPRDHQARPSTINGSDAHIKHTHQLEFVCLFDIDGAKPAVDERGNLLRRRYRVTWPIALLSCALRWRSMMLPEYSQHDPTPVPEFDRDYYTGYNQHEDQSSCNCGETMGDFLKHEDVAEASTSCTSDLMRQGLRVQTGSSSGGAARVGRSAGAARRRGISRNASSSAHAGGNVEGSVTPRARESGGGGGGAGAGGAGDGEGAGSSSRPRTASSSRHASRRPSPSTSRRPSRRSSRDISRDANGGSRNMTPDRLSIAYQEEDEYANSSGGGEEDEGGVEEGEEEGQYFFDDEGAWDSEDDDELMDKLERERQKREQLYTTQMERAAATATASTSTSMAATTQPPEPPPPWASGSGSGGGGPDMARSSSSLSSSSGLQRPLAALNLNGRGDGRRGDGQESSDSAPPCSRR